MWIKARHYGDVLGQVGEVQFAVPQLEGGLGASHDGLDLGFAPGSAGVAVEEPGQPGAAQPLDGVRVSVAGREKPQRSLVGQITAERGVPVGSEHLQQGISLPLATQHLQIARSRTGERAGVIGAAVMVLDHALSVERVDDLIDS